MPSPFLLHDNHMLGDPDADHRDGHDASLLDSDEVTIEMATDTMTISIDMAAVRPAPVPSLHKQAGAPQHNCTAVRREGVDVYLQSCFAAGLTFVITNMVLPRFIYAKDDAILAWPVVVLWVECAFCYLMFGLYTVRHTVAERVPFVLRSALVWQVLVLSSLFVCVSCLFPADGFVQQTAPSNLLIFIALSIPVVLDVCNTTSAETRITFTLSILCYVMGIVGNTLWYQNAIVFEGFNVKNDTLGRAVWTGRATKNDIRLNILYTALLLLAGSLFTAFAYDRGHTKMYICTVCVSAPQSDVEVNRRVAVDVCLKVLWAMGVVWMFTYLVLPLLLTTTDDQMWPVVTQWFLCIACCLCAGLYISRHLVKERVSRLSGSALFWQMVVLNAMHAGIGISFPESNYEMQIVPANVLIFVMLTGPMALDACSTTPAESFVTFIIETVSLVVGMIGNVVVFQNSIIFEGFSVTSDALGRDVWTGRITKNGLRFSILNVELLLLLGSLFTGLVYDANHTKMYFFKQPMNKP